MCRLRQPLTLNLISSNAYERLRTATDGHGRPRTAKHGHARPRTATDAYHLNLPDHRSPNVTANPTYGDPIPPNDTKKFKPLKSRITHHAAPTNPTQSKLLQPGPTCFFAPKLIEPCHMGRMP
jgi:hypothetical protein